MTQPQKVALRYFNAIAVRQRLGHTKWMAYSQNINHIELAVAEYLFPKGQQFCHARVFESKEGHISDFLTKQLNRAKKVSLSAQNLDSRGFKQRHMNPIAADSAKHFDI